jgi:molybdenum cofactor guanylyltransferase
MGAIDKGLLPFLGRPLIGHVIDLLKPQVGSIIVSANRHHDRYARFGVRVVSDRERDYSGPLAGISRILDDVTTPFVLIVPCDMPFLPANLAETLMKALIINGCEAAFVRGADRLQYLCLLLRHDVEQNLIHYRASGRASVRDWILGLRHCIVDFPGCPEAFFNLNTLDSLHAATLSYINGTSSVTADNQRP